MEKSELMSYIKAQHTTIKNMSDMIADILNGKQINDVVLSRYGIEKNDKGVYHYPYKYSADAFWIQTENDLLIETVEDMKKEGGQS